MRTYTLHTPDGKVINLREEAAEEPEPACETCRFWERYRDHDGHCLRYPPTVYAEPSSDPDGPSGQTIPQVMSHEWCGEYERAAQAEK